MKGQYLFSIFCFLLLTSKVSAVGANNVQKDLELIIDIQLRNDSLEYDSVPSRVVKFKRGKAVFFTLFTGFLGGHRIYFGTHHRTPIIYSITFGGLGILPLIDLAHVIFTKDLSRYEHKSQIIMWGK